MPMSLFDRSLRIICAVLLLTVAVTGSFGPVFRYSETDEATITNVARHRAELASAHSQCQHPAEHSHDILPSLQGEASLGGFSDAAYAAAPDMMRHETGISLVDPPPRT
jgi:hypothetical protein